MTKNKDMRKIGLFTGVVIMLMIMSCSTPEKRKTSIMPLGDCIVWRECETKKSCEEVFVMVDKDSMLLVVKVNDGGSIKYIHRLDVKCIEYEICEDERDN